MTPGYGSLSDRDLLARLVGVREAKKLYRGALHPLFRDEPGHNEKCLVARELVRRWLHEGIQGECLMSSPDRVKVYLLTHFARREHEAFAVLFLDSQNRLIAVEEMFRGTLTQTSVYPREVVKAALRHNAAAVILAYNHPSGVAEPSGADEALTRGLKDALSVVDVRVLDHFVVGTGSVMSFTERGLL